MPEAASFEKVPPLGMTETGVSAVLAEKFLEIQSMGGNKRRKQRNQTYIYLIPQQLTKISPKTRTPRPLS